jgi:hypothetical protein
MAATAQHSITLPKAEQKRVQELEAMLSQGNAALVSSTGERIDLPNTVYKILKKVVTLMAHGQAITLIPDNQAVTVLRTSWECHCRFSSNCLKLEQWRITGLAISDECICGMSSYTLRNGTSSGKQRSIACRERQ